MKLEISSFHILLYSQKSNLLWEVNSLASCVGENKKENSGTEMKKIGYVRSKYDDRWLIYQLMTTLILRIHLH